MNTYLLAIIISVPIIAVCIVYGMKMGGELRAQGKIVKREASFYEREFVYATPVFDLNALVEAVRRINFADAGAGVGWRIDASRQAVVFTNPSAQFEAQLQALPDGAGEHRFRFCFTHWRSRKSMTQGLTAMNCLMTALEKAMLWLDPYVTVRSQVRQIKSRSEIW